MATDPTPDKPSVGPTRIRALLGMFVVGGVLGYAFARVSIAINSVAPQVQWSAVGVLLVAAAIVLVMANATHRALHRERRPVDVHRTLRLLLLAKASALVGSIMAGGYLGFAADFVDRLNVDLPEQRVLRSIFAAVAAVLLVVGGLLLERACRIPKDDDD